VSLIPDLRYPGGHGAVGLPESRYMKRAPAADIRNCKANAAVAAHDERL
jgi:hypothetical protein